MDIRSIIDHMNNNHVKDMEMLLEKFGQIRGARDIRLKNADMECIEIAYMLDGREGVLRVDYPARVESLEGIRGAIIDLCTSVPRALDMESVREDLERFREGFDSVCIASLNPDNEVVCSYSALLSDEQDGRRQFYIYVSEVAEHFNSIKAHPDNVEVMFLEDEADAKSPILRRRLRYKTRVAFVDRGAEFDRVYENFLNRHGRGRGLEAIRDMRDFHLIRLDFIRGRFVKGFGQAYDIDIDGNISHVGGQGNPHMMPHMVKDRRDHVVDRHPEHRHGEHLHSEHPHMDHMDRREHPHRGGRNDRRHDDHKHDAGRLSR